MRITKKYLVGGVLLIACGCDCMNNTERGAVGGGLIGGGLGALAGAAVGRPLTGAAIGAGVGAGVGGLAGNAQDHAERSADAAARAYVYAHPPLQLPDVVRLTQQHIPPEMIIQQIQTTNSFYALTADDLIYLRGNGVSDTVIAVMQARRPPGWVPPPGAP